MQEVIERHRAAGVPLPRYLYTDGGCCDGNPMHSTVIPDVATPSMVIDSNNGTSTEFENIVWKVKFTVRLDGLHLIMNISRQLLGNHPRRPRFLRDLGDAIYQSNSADMKALVSARRIAHQQFPERILRAERKYLCSTIDSPKDTKNWVLKVFVEHAQLYQLAKMFKARPSIKLHPSRFAYPLLRCNVWAKLHHQLVHIEKGCLQDNASNTPYAAYPTPINYRNTGMFLREWNS